jgi:hypothetical protein
MIHRYKIENLILDYLHNEDLKRISCFELMQVVIDLSELQVESYTDIYDYVDSKFNLNYRCTQ